MKGLRKYGISGLLIAGVSIGTLVSQTPAVQRTIVERADVSAPGREAVIARVEIAPGANAGRHTHPGEASIYGLEGTFEYQIDRKAVTVKPGDVLFVPAGAIHWVKNIGSDNGAELSTYIVEKGKPLITLVK